MASQELFGPNDRGRGDRGRGDRGQPGDRPYAQLAVTSLLYQFGAWTYIWRPSWRGLSAVSCTSWSRAIRVRSRPSA